MPEAFANCRTTSVEAADGPTPAVCRDARGFAPAVLDGALRLFAATVTDLLYSYPSVPGLDLHLGGRSPGASALNAVGWGCIDTDLERAAAASLLGLVPGMRRLEGLCAHVSARHDPITVSARRLGRDCGRFSMTVSVRGLAGIAATQSALYARGIYVFRPPELLAGTMIHGAMRAFDAEAAAVRKACGLGYAEALRYLHRRGLLRTEAPVREDVECWIGCMPIQRTSAEQADGGLLAVRATSSLPTTVLARDDDARRRNPGVGVNGTLQGAAAPVV